MDDMLVRTWFFETAPFGEAFYVKEGELYKGKVIWECFEDVFQAGSRIIELQKDWIACVFDSSSQVVYYPDYESLPALITGLN